MTARGYFQIDDSSGRAGSDRSNSKRELFVPVSLVLAIGLALSMRIIYGYRVATVLPVGDAGHLATAAYTGGIAHPPGYPLFTMIGNFFTNLRFQSPAQGFDSGIFDVAFRMNMMSLWFGVLTVLVVYFIIARALKNPFAAFLGAFLFGVSSIFLSQSLIGEVYTMHAFIVAIIFYVALLVNEKLTASRLVLLSFLIGLGFAHHTLIACVIPPLALFLLLTFRSKNVILRRSVVSAMIVFFILGWLPNLYLPVTSAKDPYLDWGNPQNLSNFVDVLTRAEYRQIKNTIPLDDQSIGRAGIRHAYNLWLQTSFGKFFVWLGYLGLLITIFKGKRFGLLLGLSYLFMTVPFFIYFKNIPEHELFFLQPYYVTAHLVFAIFLGYFFSFAFERVPKIFPKRMGSAILSLLIFIGLFTATLITYGNHGSNVTMKNKTVGSRYSYDILTNLPDNAIFITLEDHIIPFIYLQQVAELRNDVVILQYESITATDKWLWQSTAVMHPDLVIPPKPDNSSDVPVNIFIDQMMISNSNRPVYFMSIPYGYFPSMNSVRFFPAGLVFRYSTDTEYANSANLDYLLYENLENSELQFDTTNLDPFEEQLLDYYVYAYYNYGANYAQMDQMDSKSERFLLKSYKLKPDGPGSGVVPTAGILAEMYMDNNEWLMAHEILKGLFDSDQTVDSVYYFLNAVALIQLRRFAEARNVIDNALEFDPANQFLLSLRFYLDKPDEELFSGFDQPDPYDLFSFDSIDNFSNE